MFICDGDILFCCLTLWFCYWWRVSIVTLLVVPVLVWIYFGHLCCDSGLSWFRGLDVRLWDKCFFLFCGLICFFVRGIC